MNKIKVVSLVGPTASGKTRLAVELARKFDGEVISADSMQIYKGMRIATAKPSAEETRGVPHHLIDFVPPGESYSVACFVRDAKAAVADISSRGRLPIIAGGTGLYVDSLLNNISFTEEKRDDALTGELWKSYERDGLEPLLDELGAFDPESAQRLKAERNPKRIIRAIEFYKTSGMTITEQNRLSREKESPYSAIKLGINYRDRQKLYDRINLRVELMLGQGLLDEARQVLSGELSSTSAMAIGYKELAPYIRGEKPLGECVERLKRETRRYAKRQLTWFRRDAEIHWLYPDELGGFEELLSEAEAVVEKGLIYG